MKSEERLQIHGQFDDGRGHLCWEGTHAEHRQLALPFVCDECRTRFDSDEEIEESTSVSPTPRPPVWLVKDGDGQYLTESTQGSAYFSEEQRDAKRFMDQGRAYRVCMRWGCEKVVRLVPRAPLQSGEEPKG